jgi:phospholipid transport system substrate-binding protein
MDAENRPVVTQLHAGWAWYRACRGSRDARRAGDDPDQESASMTSTSIRRPLAFASIVLLGLAAVPAAGAGPVGDQLRARLDRVVGVLEDRSLKARPEARRTALRGAATEIFDFTEITRRALGRHWQTATPTERGELVLLFTALLERSYVSRVEQFNGERIAMAGESLDGELATVRTRLVSRSGTETAVDYRLHRVGDRWLAYDVSVEGVSLVANYRAQFNKIIRASSAQGLVERLRAKQE